MRRSHNQQNTIPFYRRNHLITAQEIRLLDDEGKQIGVVSREEALRMGQDQGLDLVEIGPTAVPPVVKLIDYSKFLYQLKKKKQEEKKKTVKSETKEVQMSPFIGAHDFEIKLKRAHEFIEQGDKVRFVLKFRGREITKPALGRAVFTKAIDSLKEVAKVEKEMHMEGKRLIMVLSKVK